MVAKGYKQNKFYVVRQRIERFLDEVYQYVWNSKTGEPVKQHDDVQDAVRYAVYSNAKDSGGWLY
ncbi:Terminase-like family [Mycobacteroides abscessus subsp. abscessus]|nr:Terminase-like family [Mycobacteroides abscessus subsp. abscessus]